MTATKRLFIGLLADADLQGKLASYQSQWAWPEGARLVSTNSFHLTLRFLGATDPTVERKLLDWLRLVPIEPFDFQLVRCGAFDRGISWIGPGPSERLDTLHERVNAAASWAGFPMLRDAWTPHVTLARKSLKAQPPVGSLRLNWHVEGFSLISSEDGRYVPIASWAGGSTSPAGSRT